MEHVKTLLGQLQSMQEDKMRSISSLDTLRSRQQKLRNSLDDLLTQAGVPVQPLPQRMETFGTMCDQCDRFDACADKLAVVEERLARLDISMDAWRENSRQIEEVESRMRIFLEEAGVSVAGDPDVAHAYREYALRAERKRAFDQTAEHVTTLQRSTDALLSGATIAGLEKELASQEERLAALESRPSYPTV
jgi:hypothetical protein